MSEASRQPPSQSFGFGLSRNVVWLGVVSLLNDLSSDMIFPFIPIFLTSVLGASLEFVGLVEGIADATASIVKIPSGWLSDRWRRRKPFAVAGYGLSALAKPALAAATLPAHVLAVRFADRIGKGMREAPRDALISVSTERSKFGRAFGFHRGMDTLGAALGPLAAFAMLPLIHQNYRLLFLLSFAASIGAVAILVWFVREQPGERLPGDAAAGIPAVRTVVSDIRLKRDARPAPIRVGQSAGWQTLRALGGPFFWFLAIAMLASVGKASDAFLILRSREVGVAIGLVPIIYFVYNITASLLAAPFGALADRLGKRNTYIAGLGAFAAVYGGFALTRSPQAAWLLFIGYGVYAALTEGVGRAIVADLVAEERRATAYGLYNAATGIALLLASVMFGVIASRFGSQRAFAWGAALALLAAVAFLLRRGYSRRRQQF